MQKNNFDIQQFLDLTGYEANRKDRRKSKEVNSQEFFTPYSIVKRMCDKVSDADWSNPNKTFLEPCTGNGQFVVYIIWNRLQHGIDWRTVLNTIWGVELMQDNIDEMFGRIDEMLSTLCDDYDKNEAHEIMEEHFVCHDFFTWDFEEWREMNTLKKHTN